MSFNGLWECVIETPIGRQTVRFRIRDVDGELSGVAISESESVPFLDPTRNGDRLQWIQKVTKPMSLTIRFDVRFQGEELVGTAKPGILPAVRVTGVRTSLEVDS